MLSVLSVSLGHAQAGIRESEDWIVKMRVHTHLTTLSTHLGFPDTPIVSGTVVAGTIGASFGEIVVVGPVKADAKRYATALSATAKELGVTEPVLWSQENDCASALLTWGQGKLGQMSAQQSVDVGSLVTRLRSIDPKLYVSIRLPKYVHLENRLTVSYSSSSNNYYDLSKLNASQKMDVRVDLPAWLPVGAILFVALVPFGTIGGILTGIAIGKNQSIPLAKRRKLYSKFVRYGSFGTICLHIPLAMGMMFGGLLKPISDLWFGSVTMVGAFAPFLIAPIFVLFPVLALATRFEKKLFGAAPSEQALLPPAPPVSAEEASLKKKKLIVYVCLATVGLVLWVGPDIFLSPKDHMGMLFKFPGILIVVMGRFFVDFCFRKASAKFPTQTEDPDLAAEVSALAEKFSVAIRSVKVDIGPMGRANSYASVTAKGDVVMALRAKELLDENERMFIFAHELAHLKLQHSKARRLRIVIPYLIACTPLFFFPVLVASRVQIPFSPALLFSPALVAVPYMFIAGAALSKKQEYEADRLALETTGDVSVAESALRKMAMGTSMPHMHDMDEQQTHPAMWRRIQKLREQPNYA